MQQHEEFPLVWPGAVEADPDRERADIEAAVAGRSLCSVFADLTAAFPGAPLLSWREGGQVRTLTASEYRRRVRLLCLGLVERGFGPGQFAIVMGANRWEHVVADLAIAHAGGASVSVYNTNAPEQIGYIAGHCEATVAVLENAGYLERLSKVWDQLPALRHVVLMDGESADPRVSSWSDAVGDGQSRDTADPGLFDRLWRAVTPDSLLSLIYTSGTTGQPKGVTYTHRTVLWTAESMHRSLPAEIWHDGRALSYLPLAHVSERFASHWAALWHMARTSSPSEVRMVADLAQLGAELVDVRPTFFNAVPRVWEKLRAGVGAALAAQDPASAAAVTEAMASVRAEVELQQERRPVPPDVAAAAEAGRAIGALVLARLGLDQCVLAVSAAAPISREVLLFFASLGLPIHEVWGMSELTGPATLNPWRHPRYGWVGPALDGQRIRLAEDGEVLVRGGNVMPGYYRDPQRTAETLDADGWLHTGDVGELDDGWLRIVDRKKELIITSSGKNVSPSQVEALLALHPLVGQAMTVGDGQPYLAALLVLDPVAAPAWAAAHGLETSDLAALAGDPRVVREVRAAVAEANLHLARIEQVKRFVLLGREWTPESGELTSTMKLRRRVVAERYAGEIRGLYGQPPVGYDVAT